MKQGKGKLVTQAELAQTFGVSQVTVREWERAGMPIESKGRSGVAGSYDTAAVFRWRVAREVEQAMPDDPDSEGGPNLQKEVARLKKEQADGQALKNGILRGELLHIDVVVETWAHMVGAAKGGLRGIKAKLRTRIPKLTMKDLELIDGMIAKACNELAEMDVPDVRESLAKVGGGVEDSAADDAQ